jgi:hypothetical protein
MRQRLALIAVEKNNVARFGLLFAQLQAQAHPEEASSEMLAADWREVALTIARKDRKADRPSPATDLGSSWPF